MGRALNDLLECDLPLCCVNNVICTEIHLKEEAILKASKSEFSAPSPDRGTT